MEIVLISRKWIGWNQMADVCLKCCNLPENTENKTAERGACFIGGGSSPPECPFLGISLPRGERSPLRPTFPVLPQVSIPSKKDLAFSLNGIWIKISFFPLNFFCQFSDKYYNPAGSTRKRRNFEMFNSILLLVIICELALIWVEVRKK